MAHNPNIQTLVEIGQSIWYDNLSRDVLKTGELKRLIESGVSGLTSNPTIFNKAIAGTSDYDDAIRSRGKGVSDEELTEALMVEDVGAAADLLRPRYDQSQGRDGFASIEVSPFLARDAKETLKSAKRLFSALARPNVMIKIPGTKECLPAVRAALSDGINVNITLLFSVSSYQAVIEQYTSALEERISKRLPIDRIASVASFFVSRVDSITEAAISKLPNKDALLKQFRAKVAISNAWLAYEAFKESVRGKRLSALLSSGARVQRPLWASTGTKSADLPPLLYVEGLACADSVNTLPPATLKSLLGAEALRPVPAGPIEAHLQLISQLQSGGIHLDSLLQELQDVGVELFSQSYRELLQAVAKKRAQLGA